MAVPKFKTSKKRSRRRRAENMKISLSSLAVCSNCGNMKLPHRVCPKCGFYRGKQILEIEALR
jgi:large subunit ribosomal protein L32